MSAKLHFDAKAKIPLIKIDGEPLIALDIYMEVDADDEEALAVMAFLTRMVTTPNISAPNIAPPNVRTPAVTEKKQIPDSTGQQNFSDRWNFIEVE